MKIVRSLLIYHLKESTILLHVLLYMCEIYVYFDGAKTMVRSLRTVFSVSCYCQSSQGVDVRCSWMCVMLKIHFARMVPHVPGLPWTEIIVNVSQVSLTSYCPTMMISTAHILCTILLRYNLNLPCTLYISLPTDFLLF